MIISEIKIRKTMNDGNLKAIVSVTVDNSLAIHDIKVIKGSERLFVAMPSRKDENGVYRDIIHPIGVDARADFEGLILNAYENYIELEKVLESNDNIV